MLMIRQNLLADDCYICMHACMSTSGVTCLMIGIWADLCLAEVRFR